jgi:hypothetical protein
VFKGSRWQEEQNEEEYEEGRSVTEENITKITLFLFHSFYFYFPLPYLPFSLPPTNLSAYVPAYVHFSQFEFVVNNGPLHGHI